MAGRGQHFIPRHFQKPFVFSETKDQLWLYRRGRNKGIPIARGDAGKEHDFYSSPSENGDQTLDDLITDYERIIFPMVDKLRKLPVGASVDSEIAAEIVVHFFIRSQHLRKSISELWNGLAKTIYALATDPQSIVGSRRLPAHRPPAAIATAINDQIISRRLDEFTGVSAETLVRIFYMGLREKLDELTLHARETIAIVISQLGDEAKARIRDAHRDILLSSMAPPKRIERLRQLSWIILEHPDSDAILPDCVCIAASASGVWQPLLFADEVALVVMPLTPNTLLVGKEANPQSFDPREFNSLAAAACFDFFLSKEEVSLESLLKEDLGHSIRDEIEKMVSEKVLEAVESYLTTPQSEQAQILNQISLEPELQDQYSYQVILHDCGDFEDAEKISKVLSELLTEECVSDMYSVLDGFTFANDYEAVINSMDRGFEPTQFIRSENSPLGIGVAIPLTVKREGKLKTHFVLRGFLADFMLGENQNDRISAMDTIRYVLAGLALDQLVRTRFSGWMLKKIATPVEGYLYSYGSGIFDTYYSWRYASHSTGNAFERMDNLEKYLPEMISMCLEKRRLYRVNSDLDGFLTLAFEQARLALSHIAQILGIFAGVEGGRLVPDKMNEILSRFEMAEWLQLFANDLADFYENLETWRNFEEVFFVNRHFERWLLVFGIILQDQDDGQFYAHVPLGTDAEYLSQLSENNSTRSL